MSVDPTVSSLDELDASTSVLSVRVIVLRHRRSLEVIERHEEIHGGAVAGDEVLQQEEIHVPGKSNRAAVCLPGQRTGFLPLTRPYVFDE